MIMKDSATTLITALAKSSLFRDFAAAYNETTGLPLTLRPLESWQVPLHGQRKENSFCALMASKSRTCAACLQTQEKLSQCAREKPASTVCVRGLSEAAAPIRLGNRTVGFLQTGQVLRSKPTEFQFERVARQIEETGVGGRRDALREAYFKTPVLPAKKLDAILGLLGIFADHLSLKGNEIALAQVHVDPPLVTKAKQFIQEHQGEDLSLDQVAKASHTSKFNLCKLFKKATGLTFTEFLSRARTETAKKLLLDRNLRVSEIAYEVGFQSLTHFNRVFKQVVGLSPSAYRGRLKHA